MQFGDVCDVVEVGVERQDPIYASMSHHGQTEESAGEQNGLTRVDGTPAAIAFLRRHPSGTISEALKTGSVSNCGWTPSTINPIRNVLTVAHPTARRHTVSVRIVLFFMYHFSLEDGLLNLSFVDSRSRGSRTGCV